MFIYCCNNPVNFVDSNGRKSEDSRDAFNKWLLDVGYWLDDKIRKIEEIKTKHYSRNKNNPIFPSVFDSDYFEEWDNGVSANCHQFTSEDKNNVKYVSADGIYEAIYDNNGYLVTDPRDVGTYNFASPIDEPIKHVIVDVLPWIVWGNSRDDSTEWYERLFRCIGF